MTTDTTPTTRTAPPPKVISDYYGQQQGTTYLQIFSQLRGSTDRIVHRELCDQDAYDTWHLSLYFKEILAYRALLATGDLTLDVLPRKEKNLLVYLLLGCDTTLRRIVELGSSLFEMIDGLHLVEEWLAARASNHTPTAIPRVDPQEMSYRGIEISPLLAQASIELHRDYDVTIEPSCAALTESCDLIYDRNVTSYAFTSASDLASFIRHGRVALMNLFVSKGETFVSSRLGKSLTYFSLAELIEQLDRPLYHLFGQRAPGPHDGPPLSMGRPVVEGFFLYADEAFAKRFVDLGRRDAQVAGYFDEKGIKLTDAARLLD